MQLSFVTLALKNLRRKAFRTAVLVFAIGLFVALLVFAVSFTISITSTIDRVSQRLGADIIAVPIGARTEAQEYLLESRNTSFYMPASLLDEVKAIEGVKAITHQTYVSSIDGLCCDVIPTMLVAFDPDTDFILKPWLNEAIGRYRRRRGHRRRRYRRKPGFGTGGGGSHIVQHSLQHCRRFGGHRHRPGQRPVHDPGELPADHRQRPVDGAG
ncbi:ABC transporter permease [Desulfurivibrio dismutans]|uniref:ABC transporter permease n=1 Tax=Desulfurivibrio dismutans TaxID=1398908 RepID=UPI0023D9F6EE|nr:hypothetical protein [Desulfurivibrio alkaliphilus]MDF1614611.1 hypothetical protein [Desulfurivibrio alkaliphilus]